jgi:expansin (peptidoglycan-binding protein)
MIRRFLYVSSVLVAACVAAASCSSGDDSATGEDGGTTSSGSGSGGGTSSGSGSSSGTSSSSSGSGSGSDAGLKDSGPKDASVDVRTGSSSSGSSSGPREAGASSSSSSSSGAGSSSSSSGGGSSSGSSSSSSGGASSGTAGPCTWGTAFNGNASFTWYFFGQGPAPFKGACGYSVNETSNNGQNSVDVVANTANTSPASNTYFAAIPGASPGSGFSTVTDCGACIEITGANGRKIVATVVDECPVSSNSACASTGHLDISTQAFDQLGYNNGNPSGTTWKFVPCPITNSIVAVPNGSPSNNQWYFENSVYPVTSVNGQPIQTSGFFSVSPGNITITSAAVNRTITGTLPGGGGSVNAQFTAPTGCF